MRSWIIAASCAVLLFAAPSRAETVVYSQTSLAGSTPVTPGLFDELGVLAGGVSSRVDFYEIFTNHTGQDVVIDSAVVFGIVNTASTAVIVGVGTGTFNGASIVFPNPSDVRATAAVPVSTSTSGASCFTSTSGFTGCPITISFSPGALMPAGAQLAFGIIAPETTSIDAMLFGTDTINGGGEISATVPPYWTGYYFTTSAGVLEAGALGNHYLVIQGTTPSIQQVLAFFDSAVAAGTLVGSGPGNSAHGRLQALRNMLEAAANLIASGDTAEAVLQLQQAYLRTDGASPPPDFVAGPAAVQLASLIQQLIASLTG